MCPELDLCKTCLKEAIREEGLFSGDRSGGLYFFQICAACKKRSVYAHCRVYGLCLHCAALEFANFTVPDGPASRLPKKLGNGKVPNSPLPEPKPKFPSNGDLSKLGLNDVEQSIVALHHNDQPWQMSQIGQLLDLSAETVSRFYAKALLKMRGFKNPNS